MKYRGYFRVACPYFVGPKREHIRLISPIPHDISAAVLSTVCDRLLDARLFGSDPKVDALSVLTLARILLDYSDDSEEQDTFLQSELLGRTPADIISGVHVTHYQSLGQARAVSAMGTLALPGWFPVNGPEELQLWREILDEHQAILRGLRDDHSDEIGLLVLYRRFLERRKSAALSALLEFMGAYGCLVMKATGSKSGNVVRWLRRFRTDLFERLVKAMDESLVAILTDPGFRAVAAAIRDATVSAQVRRAARMPGHTNDRWIREIRYDLIPELRRKRTLPRAARFLEVVADFVASYNVENDRRRETYRTKHPYAASEEVMRSAPRNLTVEEFSRFSALCERHDVSTVGALLCAYAIRPKLRILAVCQGPESTFFAAEMPDVSVRRQPIE